MQAWGKHQAELQGWLFHRVGDRAQAQDLLQDVFLKALGQGGRFCSVTNARAWLFEVVRNTLTDHLRRQHPSEPLPDDVDEWPADEPESPPVVDQLTGCLARVLTELPEADASTQAGKWEKNRFMGVELTAKTLGLIGAGNIGSIVADRALGLKMKVVAFDPFLTPERAEQWKRVRGSGA